MELLSFSLHVNFIKFGCSLSLFHLKNFMLRACNDATCIKIYVCWMSDLTDMSHESDLTYMFHNLELSCADNFVFLLVELAHFQVLRHYSISSHLPSPNWCNAVTEFPLLNLNYISTIQYIPNSVKKIMLIEHDGYYFYLPVSNVTSYLFCDKNLINLARIVIYIYTIIIHVYSVLL